MLPYLGILSLLNSPSMITTLTLKQIGEKARKKKCRVHVGYRDLEKAYDMVNREVLWQVLRTYDEGGNKWYQEYKC